MTTDSVNEALTAVLRQPKNVRTFKRKLDALELDENEYIRVVYQTIGDILALNEITKDTLKPILKNLKKKKVGWYNPIYDDMRKKLDEYDDYLVNPFEVAEGITECGKCGSWKTFSCQKQTRSSDEMSTTFSKCVQCGAEWTYSG
jgi:DNA-directed RNA polymerase subunit M/transcription elongation factor TFIIS